MKSGRIINVRLWLKCVCFFANDCDGDNDDDNDDKWKDNLYLLVYSEISLICNSDNCFIFSHYDLDVHMAAISDHKLTRVDTCRNNVKYQAHFKIDLYSSYSRSRKLAARKYTQRATKIWNPPSVLWTVTYSTTKIT
jgi:hypothetical protein